MKQATVISLVRDQLYPLFKQQRADMDAIDQWYRTDPPQLPLPRRASQEHKDLADLAQTPWLGVVVTTTAQGLEVCGYKTQAGDESGPWATWAANDFESRQDAVHRAALAYGQSYVRVMPGTSNAVMRGISPRRMVAVYADPAEDDWPLYAADFAPSGKTSYMVRVEDEEQSYFVSIGADGGDIEFIESRVHNAGVTPVVRYANMLDLDGRCDGEVTPFIPVAKRLNKTTYDRLLAQHFNSWNVRVISGIDVTDGPGAAQDGESDAAARDRALTRLRQNDILTLKDPQSKATTLPATPLDGFGGAREDDIEDLSAISQTPVTAFSRLSNISAETLVEIRAGLNQKIGERKRSFGKSHAQALRLAAHLEGDETAAQEYTAKIEWTDHRVRPCGATVDALGKAAQMLQVPVQELWEELPWLDQTDLADMKRAANTATAQAARSRVAEAAQAARQDPEVSRLVSRADAG